MVCQLSDLSVESQILPMNALRVAYDRDPSQCKSRRQVDVSTRVLLPDGRDMRVSERFWTSWASMFGLSRSVFDYFTPEEVFDRITRTRGDNVRVTFEQPVSHIGGRLLSCTKPGKPLLPKTHAERLIDQFAGEGVSYADGVVTARFDCPFPLDFEIAGDGFKTQFHMAMPIDGYGLPSAYLALLRLVCSNGLIGVTPAFRTTFQLGRNETDLDAVLRRAMETFSNEEGFRSFRDRVESATCSWASLHEAMSLRKTLSRALTGRQAADGNASPLLEEFDRTCGDPLGFYGLSGQEELSARKARTLPVESTVYDMLNFASEVATHHLANKGAKDRVNAWVGQALVGEYDLEGTAETCPDFRDFFLDQSPSAPASPAA